MKTQLAFAVTARRSRDTEALAEVLERVFREHTVGDADLDSTRVMPKARGGYIECRAFVDTDDPMPLARAIGQAIDTNANLIDRVDHYRVAAFDGNKLLGFVQGEYTGWLRQSAIDDLKERTGAQS